MELFFFVFVYLFFINIIGLVLMYCDKKRAVNREWRIKEKNMLLILL